MPKSFWKANIQEFLDMFEEEPELLHHMLFNPIITNITSDEQDDTKEATITDVPNEKKDSNIPEELPILPLRGVVVYPQTVIPLTIGQPRSIRLVDAVMAGDARMIGLVASKKPELDTPAPKDLYDVGTVAIVHRMFRAPDGTIRLVVQGISRCKVQEYTQEEPFLKAKIELFPETVDEGLELEALARKVRDQFEHIAEMVPSIPKELVASITSIEDALQICYTIANFQRMELADAQAILELDPASAKLHKLLNLLTHEVEVLEMGQKIQDEARSEIEKVQREYYLREQLKAIQRELGEGDEQSAEIEEFRKKIEEAGMTEEAKKQALRELDRLQRLPTAAAEYGVIRTYLDWLVSLPWNKMTEDNLDIAHAREILDRDHYGLTDVKERILEFLAVRKLRQERAEELEKEPEDEIHRVREGIILCFVGPPGVGKTSLGKSIAHALGRKFIRISLGGVRDEAEIRGHRRTYIGAMPGRIIQAIRRVESRNPVFMLDEVDKLVFDFHGDPASALLEVLDPEQNYEFRDHYLEVAFDLSQVMFITTANLLDTIPGPLRDRMEIITLSGYTESEKIEIAKGYLIPRQIKENGLRKEEIKFTEGSLRKIIRSYTREAGVRNLEREIGAICRKVVTQIAEGKVKKVTINEKEVEKLLGHPRYYNDQEIIERTSIPGVATGLAWTPTGGDILFIEATKMPGNKNFQITGSIGNVMQESAQAALSYIRSKAKSLGIDENFFEKTDIHLHVPAGAQPKDGPSAGVTIATALVSLLTGKPVKPDVCMTGEITLRGQVLPVGGIKEKVLAAHRAGLKTVILPAKNKPDLDDIPEEIRKSIHFIFAETIDDVWKNALESPPIKRRQTRRTKQNKQSKEENS